MVARTPIAADTVVADSTVGYPPPFRARMGRANWRALGNPFGLTQFGVNLETLEPGARSSLRHWHSLVDEFIYMLEGELVLLTSDGAFLLTPGMCMGFKAGDHNAHHLVNKSEAAARFLVVGSRVPGDVVFYPDDDLAYFVTERGRVAVHKDGTPYPPPADKG